MKLTALKNKWKELRTVMTATNIAFKFDAWVDFYDTNLQLWMFVPCDEKGNVLEEPRNFQPILGSGYDDTEQWVIDCREYQKAKDRVIFDVDSLTIKKQSRGIRITGLSKLIYDNVTGFRGKTIEDLVDLGLTIKETAIKRYNL